MRPRLSALLAAAAIHIIAPTPACAHLMAPGRATVNVVGDSVFSVVWLPASALDGVAHEPDGTVRQAALEAGQAEVVARLGDRWRLSDGGETASTVRLDLILQPPDDAAPGRGDRADQLVMLHHARFSHPPRELRLDTDLAVSRSVGGEGGDALTVNATRDEESEVAVFGTAASAHVFFHAGAAPAEPVRRAGFPPFTVEIAAILLFLCGIARWAARSSSSARRGAAAA
mgnify:CR=1 FL=1